MQRTPHLQLVLGSRLPDRSHQRGTSWSCRRHSDRDPRRAIPDIEDAPIHGTMAPRPAQRPDGQCYATLYRCPVPIKSPETTPQSAPPPIPAVVHWNSYQESGTVESQFVRGPPGGHLHGTGKLTPVGRAGHVERVSFEEFSGGVGLGLCGSVALATGGTGLADR